MKTFLRKAHGFCVGTCVCICAHVPLLCTADNVRTPFCSPLSSGSMGVLSAIFFPSIHVLLMALLHPDGYMS